MINCYTILKINYNYILKINYKYSMNNINLCIKDYSIDDLFSLININTDDYTDKQTLEDNITNDINLLVEHFDDNAEYISFFEKVKDILLQHINYIFDNNSNTLITKTQESNYDNDHNVIQKPSIISIDTFSNNTPSGTLNPIRRHTVTKLVNIDTIFRKNYNTTISSNFMYDFPSPINNIISMKLSSIEIPNTWYIISNNKKSNVFSISTLNVTGIPDTTHNIIIPEGNYSLSNLIDVVNNYFINTGNGLEYIRFDVNMLTLKAIIRAKNSTDSGGGLVPYVAGFSPNFEFNISFDVIGIDSKKTLGWLLGFRLNSYNVSQTDTYTDNINVVPPTLYTGYLISEGIYGGSISRYFLFSLNDFNNSFKNSIISLNDKSFIGDDILGRITINSSSNTIILDNTSDNIYKQRDFFGPVKIEKIHVKLLDKYGDILDINNVDFSFVLEFKQIYN